MKPQTQSIGLVVVVALLMTCGIIAAQGQTKRVLFVPRGIGARDQLIEREAFRIITGLRDAGFTVEIATDSGQRYRGVKLAIDVDYKLNDVDISKYNAVVFACMAQGNFGEWHASEDEKGIVREAARRNILLAAQDGSIVILAEAGVLVGKKYAFLKDKSTYKVMAKTEYAGQGVIRDGQIITSSGCPLVPAEYGEENKDYTTMYIEEITKALQE
jgi:putative intracellular protease/amidase